MSSYIIIPTYNAGESWKLVINSILDQNAKINVLVIDSSSTDQTKIESLAAKFSYHSILKSSFDHGDTRNRAVKFLDNSVDFLVFMTQDAILASPNALLELLAPFSDPCVAAVYGRQLPHRNATPIATHARLFNYPAESQIKSKENIKQLGVKCAFISNSFAAYRRSVFEELGGFPKNTILSEDMYLAARMILSGYKVVYCAEATVYHSHNYSLLQEFCRYFDIGVFQQKEQWIQDAFGKVGDEGRKFVLSEIKFLFNNSPLWIPRACLSSLFKFVGFKLGTYWYLLPRRLLYMLSMHKGYWENKNAE